MRPAATEPQEQEIATASSSSGETGKRRLTHGNPEKLDCRFARLDRRRLRWQATCAASRGAGRCLLVLLHQLAGSDSDVSQVRVLDVLDVTRRRGADIVGREPAQLVDAVFRSLQLFSIQVRPSEEVSLLRIQMPHPVWGISPFHLGLQPANQEMIPLRMPLDVKAYGPRKGSTSELARCVFQVCSWRRAPCIVTVQEGVRICCKCLLFQSGRRGSRGRSRPGARKRSAARSCARCASPPATS